MTNELALGGGAEFDAIRRMLARWGSRAEGIGDDAAVLRLPRGDALVASVDTAVEGRHFQRHWFTPREIGYRAVAAALSDLAAMAATPVGILVAITVPESWRASLDELADGIGDAADMAKTKIRGGNLAGGSELSMTTTVLGSAFSPATRSGAREGDTLYVTGRFGGPRAALGQLLAGLPGGEHRRRLAHPVPRLAEARWLVDAGASAMIDVSDGLAADAGHLAAASGVRLELDASIVPRVNGVDTEQALGSGEEYELLVTSPRELDTASFAKRFGHPLTGIGRVAAGQPGSVDVRGARFASVAGYDHFNH
jgi:thiamine-monophosphate kinase